MSDRVSMVAGELLATEESYVSSLDILLSVIVPVLKQDKISGMDSAVLALISNAEQVHTVNLKFLADLDKMIRGASKDAQSLALNDVDAKKLRIGGLFLDYAPLFKIYAQYAKNHENGVNAIQRLRGTNPRLNRVIMEAEKEPRCRGQSLWSFLIMPIQRVPRYVLLLKELQKRMEDNHPDKKSIGEAINKIGEVGDFLNEAIRKRENNEKIAALEARFSNPVELLVPGRVLLKEGMLKKLSHKGHVGEYEFHLFNDLLIYSKQNMKGWELKQRIDLLNLSTELLEKYDVIGETVEPKSVFKLTSPAISFVVIAKNEKECQDWMQAINDAINSVDRSGKLKLETQNFVAQFFGKIANKSGAPTPSMSSTDVFKEAAPVWVPDTEATNCTICDAEFTFVNRKHHCRSCGAVVCNPCSPYKRILENLGTDPVRVCKNCDDSLRKAYKAKHGKPFFLVKGKIKGAGNKREMDDIEEDEDEKKEEIDEMDIDQSVTSSSTWVGTTTRRKKKQTATTTQGLTDIFGSKTIASASNNEEDTSESMDSKVEEKESKVKFNRDTDDAETTKDRLSEIKSIMNSEKTYVDNLKTLLDVYITPLSNSHPALVKKLTSVSAVSVCFDCVEQILTVHGKFLRDLQDRVENWEKNPNVGDIFVSLAPLFRIYGNYAANFEDALVSLRSPTFLDSVKKHGGDSRANGKKITDYLNSPMQRVIFYARDWKNLMKLTPQDHKDYKDLQIAMESLSEAAVHIQEAVQMRENRTRLLQIEETFIGKVELITPSRRFVREGLLQIADKKGVFQKRHCHLFNDIMLCSESTNIGYNLKKIYNISSMISIEKLDATNLGPPFIFAVRGIDSSFMASASNTTLRDGWVRDLSTAIATHAKNRMIKETSPYSIENAAPLWTPDSASDKCNLCRTQFTWWNRKHHCRKCGNLVCNNCTPHRVILPASSDTNPVRICTKCMLENPNLKDLGDPLSAALKGDSPTVHRPSSGSGSEFRPDLKAKGSITSEHDIPAAVRGSMVQTDTRPSDQFLNRTFGDRPVQKFVTEDGKVFYYDAERDQSAWELQKLVQGDEPSKDDNMADGTEMVVDDADQFQE